MTAEIIRFPRGRITRLPNVLVEGISIVSRYGMKREINPMHAMLDQSVTVHAADGSCIAQAAFWYGDEEADPQPA